MGKFKDYEQVKNMNGWAKMYYDFDDLDRLDSIAFLCYLIDNEPDITSTDRKVRKRFCREEGFEDYVRYSTEYIEEQFPMITRDVLKNVIDDLEYHKYISVHRAHGNPKGKRYIKLNHDVLADAIGVDLTVVDSVVDSDVDSVVEGVAEGVVEIQQHIQTNRLSDKQTNKETEKEREAKAFPLHENTREVLEYLNSKVNSSYDYNQAINVKDISLRLKEGETLEACKAVIDNRCEAWLKEPKMRQFLRPSTIFKKDKYYTYKGSLSLRNSPQADVKRFASEDEINRRKAVKEAEQNKAKVEVQAQLANGIARAI